MSTGTVCWKSSTGLGTCGKRRRRQIVDNLPEADGVRDIAASSISDDQLDEEILDGKSDREAKQGLFQFYWLTTTR